MLDVVRGTIIGGAYVSGQLWANGRSQGNQIHAETETELKQKAEEAVKKLRKQLEPCAGEFARLYPNGIELRIYD